MSKTISSPEWWSRKNSDSSVMACCTVPCHLERGRQRSRAYARPPNEAPQGDGPSGGLQQTRREQPAHDRKENSSIHCEFLIPVNLFATTVAPVPIPVRRVTDS